jgi:glucose-1-phosphate thymidylyltransferase
MKAVILAAGKGSRLFPVTKAIAKPLLPLANRMTMEYAFDQLKACGITEICVVVGENEQEMRSALGDGAQFGVSLSFALQDKPLGLAHAVGCAEEFCGGESFALYLGDAIYSGSLAPHVAAFESSDAASLLLVKEVEDPRRFGVANLADGKIVKLVEKPQNPESNWALAGFYVFGPEIWSGIHRVKPSARGELEITDAIQILIEDGLTVLPGKFTDDWYDSGTLESFLTVSRAVTKGENVIAPDAKIDAEIGSNVVVGAGARVSCDLLQNTVCLPGAVIAVDGPITGCLLGGEVTSDSGLEDQILWGDLT